MNLKNLRRLRRRLLRKEQPVRFNMRPVFEHQGERVYQVGRAAKIVKTHACGTAACLAGHAAMEAVRYGDVPENSRRGICGLAVEWLGLSEDEAFSLFNGYWGHDARRPVKNLGDLTKARAIKEIDRLIDVAKHA